MLAAGIAHEINNPASFVLANVDALAGMLRKVDETLRSDNIYATKRPGDQLFDAMTVVQESKEGMARIHRIARDLHSFSRVDDDANSLSDVNVRGGLRADHAAQRTALPGNGRTKSTREPDSCAPARPVWARCF